MRILSSCVESSRVPRDPAFPQAWLDDAVDQYKKVADALDKPGITPEQLDGLMLSLPWTRLLLEQIESELAEGVSFINPSV